MKNVTKLMDEYQSSLKKIESKNLAKHEQLKFKIKAAKRYLHKIRVYVRDMKFKDLNEEITFFKTIKPKITADIKLYNHQLAYHHEKPFISLEKQKKYIQKKLRELENKKKKHIKFYRYMRLEETAYDELYFSREKERLELFPFSDFDNTDLEFTTSHDLLACEVVTYDLLTEFYKQELYCLNNLETMSLEPKINSIEKKFTWSGSKTDLIELIYAFHSVGVLNNGNIDIKEIATYFEEIFNVSLGDYYRSFQDIRARKINQTKFIDKLKESFTQRLQNIDE